MYKKQTNRQLTIYDFDQPLGLTMNPENRWVKKADSIPWSVIEDKYAALFNSDRGNIAKPVRMALGALIIQSEFQYADTEVVNQIRENPYLQYFVGLPSYKDEKPFDASSMVHFRKRLSSEILIEINELILKSIEDGVPLRQVAVGAVSDRCLSGQIPPRPSGPGRVDAVRRRGRPPQQAASAHRHQQCAECR